ncbi:MAG: hypothetical protein U5J96_04100 [Ignavibacteriaceae bacterium]|nr:hypothetical protein [Ignavibacteriaceae bacterium]
MEKIGRADFTLPASEEFYRVALTIFDETESEHFTVRSALKVTTAGPAELDSISWTQLSTFFYSVKPFVKNRSTVTTITNASVKLICKDAWVISINPSSLTLPDISPRCYSQYFNWIYSRGRYINISGLFQFRSRNNKQWMAILDRLNACTADYHRTRRGMFCSTNI